MKRKALLLLTAGIVLMVIGFTITTKVMVIFHHEINDNEGVGVAVDGNAFLLDRFGRDIAAPSISVGFLMANGIEVSSMNISFVWSVSGLDVDWTSLVVSIQRDLVIHQGLEEIPERIGVILSSEQIAEYQEVIELGRHVPLQLDVNELGHGEVIRVEYLVNMTVSARNVYGAPLKTQGIFGIYFEMEWDSVNEDIRVSATSESGMGFANSVIGVDWSPTSVFGGNLVAMPIIFAGLGCFALFIILNKKKMLLG